jgi:hypothetical protein
LFSTCVPAAHRRSVVSLEQQGHIKVVQNDEKYNAVRCCLLCISLCFLFYFRGKGCRGAFGIRMETPAMKSTVCTSKRFAK